MPKNGVSQVRLALFTSFVKKRRFPLVVSDYLLTFAQWFLRPTEQAAKAERQVVSCANGMVQ